MYVQTRNDAFRSVLSGKEYLFHSSPDNADRKRALESLRADDAKIIEAQNQKAGRRLTWREHQAGWQADTRPFREKFAEQVQVTSQPKHNADDNPHRKRIAEVMEDYRLTPAQRQRRIQMAELAAELWDRERAATKEREAKLSSSEYRSAKLDCETTILLCKTNPLAPREWLDSVKQRMSQLEETLDTSRYWKDTLAWESQRDRFLAECADRLETEAAKMKTDASSIRAGEAPRAEQ